jgi:hypothetical protein
MTEIFACIGFDAAQNGIFLTTFRGNISVHLQGGHSWTARHLKNELKGSHETSVIK